MNRRALLAAALGTAGLAACERSRPKAPPTTAGESGDELIGSILSRTGAPALGGAVVTADGLPWLEVGGLRRQDRPDPVTRGDLWHVGSNAKAMTAALYARLVERGAARWGAAVPELFPDRTVAPGWRAVTVEQLLGHRSGLTDAAVLSPVRMLRAFADERPVQEQRAAFAADVLAAGPAGTPGAFSYANANYILAGAAIERLTGLKWEDAIRRELFTALGMTSAGFGAPEDGQPQGHRSRPFNWGHTVAKGADNPALLGPAGRVHLSLEDHARFLRMFLTGGGGVLTKDSVMRLTRRVPGPGDAYALGWGVTLDEPWARGPLLAHEGSNTMWHAVAMLASARGLGFLAVSNDHSRGAAACRDLAKALVRRFAADSQDPPGVSRAS